MLIDFFLHLRHAKLPVSIKEYLMLLEAMREHVIGPSIDDFYYLSRATLVKDERNFDKFDKAFGAYFKGVQSLPGIDLAHEHAIAEQDRKRQAFGGGFESEETKGGHGRFDQ